MCDVIDLIEYNSCLNNQTLSKWMHRAFYPLTRRKPVQTLINKINDGLIVISNVVAACEIYREIRLRGRDITSLNFPLAGTCEGTSRGYVPTPFHQTFFFFLQI